MPTKFAYYKQNFAQGYWRIRREPVGCHSGQHSNVHTWVLLAAFGGKTPKRAERCEVSHIFQQYECSPIKWRDLPRTWRNAFRKKQVRREA